MAPSLADVQALPAVPQPKWHQIGLLISLISQAVIGLAAISSTPPMRAPGWIWFAVGTLALLVVYPLCRHRTHSAWLLVWPVWCLVRIFVFGLGDSAAAQLVTGLITVFFLFIGLTQPPGRSLWMVPAALLTLGGVVHLPLASAVVRYTIAVLVWTIAAELPAFLMSKLAAQRKLLQDMAVTDPLTGAKNRRALDELLGVWKGQAFLVILDLDEFKHFNDTFGHLAGDEVLIDFAELLMTQSRRGDAVFRYGGEEFLVVLGGADREAAQAAVRRWSKQWSEHYSGVSFSAGITDLVGQDATHRADQSLYAAKAAGRSRSVTTVAGNPTGVVADLRTVGRGVIAFPRADQPLLDA